MKPYVSARVAYCVPKMMISVKLLVTKSRMTLTREVCLSSTRAVVDGDNEGQWARKLVGLVNVHANIVRVWPNVGGDLHQLVLRREGTKSVESYRSESTDDGNKHF